MMNSSFGSRLAMLAAPAVLVAGVAVAGCNGGPGGHARTPLDEVQGLTRTDLAGRLAEEGLSVGDLRSAVLPDGLTVAILTPQPSDGYTPQVTVVRLDDGVPNRQAEVVCDPFLWTVNIDAAQFGGLDPAKITDVTWEDWVGNGRSDLVVEFMMSASAHDEYTGSFDSAFRARCAFRTVDDQGYGRLAAAVFGWLAEASSKSEYSDTRTEIVERHEPLAVAGEPEQLDYRITSEVLSCSPGPQGAGLCNPRTDITIRRYTTAGQGIELAYLPIEEAAYVYPTPSYNQYTGLYGPECDEPGSCEDLTDGYHPAGEDLTDGYHPAGEDLTDGYDPTGYDTPTGYDDTATDYDDTATGYDDTATGYDDTATDYDEEAVGE